MIELIGSEIYGRWNDTCKWTFGILKGETKNGFEVYNFCIENYEFIEFYHEISIDPYNGTEIFVSKKFKDRNYKNYCFRLTRNL